MSLLEVLGMFRCSAMRKRVNVRRRRLRLTASPSLDCVLLPGFTRDLAENVRLWVGKCWELWVVTGLLFVDGFEVV